MHGCIIGIGRPNFLNDLLDVDAPSPSDGEALTWVAANSQWEPGSATVTIGPGQVAFGAAGTGDITSDANFTYDGSSLVYSATNPAEFRGTGTDSIQIGRLSVSAGTNGTAVGRDAIASNFNSSAFDRDWETE